MFGFLKKIFAPRAVRREIPDPDAIIAEHWDADFTQPHQIRFDIKSETAYDAYLRPGALALGLKKSNCIVWVEDPQFRYGDQVIEGKIRLDAHGAYAAAGFMFRMVDERTYYSVLVSNKGFFRLDVLRNGMPCPLVGWTEAPAFDGTPLSAARVTGLTIIAYGNHILLVINGQWAAEIHDTTIPAGRLCFTAASYEANPSGKETDYTAEAFLEALSVESRILEVEARYEKWAEQTTIAPINRFRLAETFAAMGQPVPALVQLKKNWERPDYRKTPKELLLAARLALGLDLTGEAEEYINGCVAAGADTPEGREAGTEKAKLLYMMKRYGDLKTYGEMNGSADPVQYVLLGHAYVNLGEHENAAGAYDRAFELDPENGLPAKNAANAYELLGRKAEALDRYLKAGRAFLSQENYTDLGNLVPKLLSLGGQNWEAHGLAGKWAFGIEDWALADREFAEAERLRRAAAPALPQDPALVFLRGLLLVRAGKRREALPLMEEAADLAPDYALFRFRLAENRFLLSGDSGDPKLMADLEAALTLAPDDGWIANLAAQIALSEGNTEKAARHLEKAALVLGEVPAIRVNRGVLCYLQGSVDEALAVLKAEKADDPGGLMTNCAGNLLVRAGRYEEADIYYRKALLIAPDNMEYLCNRASCLIELGSYGEADDILTRAHQRDPSPVILELIAYVAVKKGEYPRAETACKAALEMEPRHVPSLLSLGWIYSITGRWEETKEIIRRLDELDLNRDDALRREELRSRLEDALTRVIVCAACGRTWRIPRNPAPVKPIRLFAMPPDDLPAGTCPQCGGTYCIGCGKGSLDTDNRFLCPKCGKSLKLMDGGLKKLVFDWAAGAIPRQE
ncbi:MAG: tetratricopeptide repeat protein [Spirochaetaceae bacterium]|jgi:tetratricopeptide (TPR) repeat protein|nr:tetratricopeptide repeat protein [Spirochaetaceae bacterium]